METQTAVNDNPPGWPGLPARWTSSAKSGVGTSVTNESRIWFSLSHGIIDEVYHPTVDRANTRDLGFLITHKDGFFSEEKRDAEHEIQHLSHGVPCYRLINTCKLGRYRLIKTIFTDSQRDVLIQKVEFQALDGALSDYGLYALLAPHIDNQGAGCDGWAGDYKGIPMLFASRDHIALALACSAPWRGRSCGFVGVSDGWQDIRAHSGMTWFYPEARNGNIALTGEVDIAACGGAFTMALAIDATPTEAGQQARTVLLTDVAGTLNDYIHGWRDLQSHCTDMKSASRDGFDLYRVSTAVLRTHDGKQFPGGLIASLSIPWGFAKGDNDLGGYHLVWPRDQVEATGALIASGNAGAARNTLLYLMSTQEPDGHWPQNMWLDGRAYWSGIQNDETAFVILLADTLRRSNGLGGLRPWPTVKSAVQYLVNKGPVTMQDRWEENAGLSIFTLSAEIASLLAAANFADMEGEKLMAQYLRETADTWNANIERWTYVTDTDLAHRVGVDGYYIRIAPPSVAVTGDPASSTVTLKNRPMGDDQFPAAEIVSPDALALVRFGLRAPDDPKILNTIKVIDATLKSETSNGPVWHRYPHDGYGEHEDGSPFDGTGVGRGWPLLAGERAHYELAAGNLAEAERLMNVIAAQTSPGGLIPEQVWDSGDIPEKELINGCPSGSGMPLVWAHAEYIKLVRSLHDGKVFDLDPTTWQRYVVDNAKSSLAFWRFAYPMPRITPGLLLRLEVNARAMVHWTTDRWKTSQDIATRDTGLGVYVADLQTEGLPHGTSVTFTFYWPDSDRWEGQNFSVAIGQSTLRSAAWE